VGSPTHLRTNVVVGEIEEQLLDAEENVRLGKHVKLDQLAQEAADLQLGLYIDLVLRAHVPSATNLSQYIMGEEKFLSII
jgi:hypothetical protein